MRRVALTINGSPGTRYWYWFNDANKTNSYELRQEVYRAKWNMLKEEVIGLWICVLFFFFLLLYLLRSAGIICVITFGDLMNGK